MTMRLQTATGWRRLAALCSVAALLATACGGVGTGGTGSFAMGPITGFGSVIVDGTVDSDVEEKDVGDLVIGAGAYDGRNLSTDDRLGVPWCAYDTLTLSGQVVEVEGQLVTVGVTGTGALGKHIVATTRLLLPEDPVP